MENDRAYLKCIANSILFMELLLSMVATCIFHIKGHELAGTLFVTMEPAKSKAWSSETLVRGICKVDQQPDGELRVPLTDDGLVHELQAFDGVIFLFTNGIPNV